MLWYLCLLSSKYVPLIILKLTNVINLKIIYSKYLENWGKLICHNCLSLLLTNSVNQVVRQPKILYFISLITKTIKLKDYRIVIWPFIKPQKEPHSAFTWPSWNMTFHITKQSKFHVSIFLFLKFQNTVTIKFWEPLQLCLTMFDYNKRLQQKPLYVF